MIFDEKKWLCSYDSKESIYKTNNCLNKYKCKTIFKGQENKLCLLLKNVVYLEFVPSKTDCLK